MHTRQKIELIDGRPTPGGQVITPLDMLEMRSGGRWQQVSLGKSNDHYKRWVLTIGTLTKRIERIGRTTMKWLYISILAGILAGMTPTAALGHNFAGAWWVSSAGAVDALEAKGFNTFMIPAGHLPNSTIEAMLLATNPGNYAIIDLTYFSSKDDLGGAVDYLYRSIIQGSQYSKVRGYLTFDEPNCGSHPIPIEKIRLWYRVIKALDPSRWIFVDYCANECEIPHTSSVDNEGGYSYDSAMINFYPYHHGWTDRVGEEKLRATVAHVKQYFHPSTWLWPINQAAYRSSNFRKDDLPCGNLGRNNEPDLRQHYDLSQQYEIWDELGLFEQSHGIFYYGWESKPEDKNLATDSFMLEQTRIMIAEHEKRHP